MSAEYSTCSCILAPTFGLLKKKHKIIKFNLCFPQRRKMMQKQVFPCQPDLLKSYMEHVYNSKNSFKITVYCLRNMLLLLLTISPFFSIFHDLSLLFYLPLYLFFLSSPVSLTHIFSLFIYLFLIISLLLIISLFLYLFWLRHVYQIATDCYTIVLCVKNYIILYLF